MRHHRRLVVALTGVLALGSAMVCEGPAEAEAAADALTVAPTWLQGPTSVVNEGWGLHAENTTVSQVDPATVRLHADAAGIDGSFLDALGCLSGNGCDLGTIMSLFGVVQNSVAQTSFSTDFTLQGGSGCTTDVIVSASLDGVVGTLAGGLSYAKSKGWANLAVEHRDAVGGLVQRVVLLDDANATKEIESAAADAKFDRLHPAVAPVTLRMASGDHLVIQGSLRIDVNPIAVYGTAAALAVFGYPGTSGPLNVLGTVLPDPGLTTTATILPTPDTDPPVTTLALAGTHGTGDWFRSDVAATLDSSDGACGSGVAVTEYSIDDGPWTTYTAPVVVSVDGVTTMRYRSTDAQSNVEATNTATISIDRAPPTTTIVSPERTAYPHTALIPIEWVSTDDVSGIATTTATLDGSPVSNGTELDALLLPLGRHHLKVTATDNAGNVTVARRSFTIIATIDSLREAITRFAADGSIDNQGVANSLLRRLRTAEAFLDRGQVRQARWQLLVLSCRLRSQRGKHISEDAFALLSGDLQHVIAHLGRRT